MTIYAWLILALWLTLVVYWGLAARVLKRSIDSRWIWWREIAVRLGFFALVVLALQVAGVRHVLPNARLYSPNTSMLVGLVGFVFCAIGIGLAILARAYLERNRRMPISDQGSARLVTTGPYAFVRHPIYSGMLLAMLGSAIGQSALWMLPLIVYGPGFVLSARNEEKLLSERFPEQYRAYTQRTKMLLPFVL